MNAAAAAAPVYLTEGDVERLAPPPGELADALAAAFRQRHAGDVVMPPKCRLAHKGSDAFFHAMPALVPGVGAGLKWIGGSPSNSQRGLAHLHALMVLSDGESGRPVAVVESAYLTGIRTAAVSLLAARRLARPDARRLALIGCGLQARTHLAALGAEFPLETVVLAARRRQSAVAFASHARAAGLEAEIANDPAAALDGVDIAVSTVPEQQGLRPFLDPWRLPAGALALMVDLGRSWRAEGLVAFERIFTDDLEQSRALSGDNPAFAAARFAGDLGAIEAGATPGRRSAEERLAFLFPGAAFTDVAAAELLLRRAHGEHGSRAG